MKKVKPAITIEDADLRKKIIQLPEKEASLFNTNLPIRAPYQFLDFDGILLIVASEFKTIKDEEIMNLTVGEFENYFVNGKEINPFSKENLLEDLANINLTDEESILSFCNHYGLFGQAVLNTPSSSLFVDPSKMEIKEKVFVNCYETFDYFFETASWLKYILKIFYEEIPLLEDEYEKTKDDKKLEELNELRRGAITFVNRALRLVSPQIDFREEDGEYLPSYSSVTLLGAAYHQLSEAITKKKQFRTCLNCRSLFVPRVHNGLFCPPIEIGKRSTCENSYQQMKKRARDTVLLGGKTIEEVAKTIGRPLQEVKKWFD
ncbi:hypothetical protein ACIQY5_25605 [Peribacillus frigoritolerans]|uniref:hypothetical protein n=1 Tax=Peribacillus frigoritolerans TaxID=450367 RepID=UPI0038267447